MEIYGRCIRLPPRALRLVPILWLAAHAMTVDLAIAQETDRAAVVEDAGPFPTTSSAEAARERHFAKWRLVFFWTVVLLIVFVVAAGVIVRFSERFRALLLRGKSRPTPTEDVWLMHKTPEYGEDNEPGGEGRDAER